MHTIASLQRISRRIVAEHPDKRDEIFDILQMCFDDRDEMGEPAAVSLAATAIRDQFGVEFFNHYADAR